MRIHVLFDQSGRHIEINGKPTDVLARDSIDDIVEQVKTGQEALAAIAIDDIIGLFDSIASNWRQSQHPLTPLIRDKGLGFLPIWMRRQNLASICDLSTNGHRAALDGFVGLSDEDPRLFRCQPRGLIVHWIAGNVPVLGMISMIQGILGKNATILKASHNDSGLLPALLDSFKDVSFITPSGKKISGDILANSVAVVYADRNDVEASHQLSTVADVRVAWGGREAVESIMNLPRRFGTEDIIFGPKVSLVIIGSEYLESEDTARKLAQRIVRDVSAFDQRGCNSPHTVFVETGGVIHPGQLAAIISQEMKSALANRPLRDAQPGDSMNVLGVRTEYDMRGDAYYSEGMGWTVAYSDHDTGLAAPCYLRTLFIRPVADIFDVVPFCSVNTQTAGLAVHDRRFELADALTRAGIERCPTVGAMSLYESPWDGMFPVSRMLRWVSIYRD